eukprot:1068347-Prorocentrum_minimum.AAC.2
MFEGAECPRGAQETTRPDPTRPDPTRPAPRTRRRFSFRRFASPVLTTTDQSDAGSVGTFSRRTNHTQ